MLEELNLYDESNIHFDSLRNVFYGDTELNAMDLDGDEHISVYEHCMYNIQPSVEVVC